MFDKEKYEKIKNGCYVRVLSGRFAREIHRTSGVSKIFTLRESNKSLSSHYYVYCPTGVIDYNVSILSDDEVEEFLNKFKSL